MLGLGEPKSDGDPTPHDASSARLNPPGASFPGGPILWIMISGLLLIAAIAVGTVLAANSLRGRALEFAEWHGQTELLVRAAGLTTLVVAVVLLLVVRKFARLHRSARHQLDTALNNMTQGLMQYDSASRIVLFNRRYVEMYGLSLEVIRPGRLFRDVMKHRKQTGSFEGDPDQFCDAVLKNVDEKKLTHPILTTKSGLGMLQPSAQSCGAGASRGSPAGALAATHAASVAISSLLNDGSFANRPIPATANHGGIDLFCVAKRIAPAYCRASS